MSKKYELLKDNTIEIGHITLYRIRALQDIGNDVLKGEIGGYVQSEKNLSQNGECWIYSQGKVYENARVVRNAQVFERAEVFGNAKLDYWAQAHGGAKVFDYAQMTGESQAYGNSRVYGNAKMSENSRAYGTAHIGGNHVMKGYERVHDGVHVGADLSQFPRTTQSLREVAQSSRDASQDLAGNGKNAPEQEVR